MPRPSDIAGFVEHYLMKTQDVFEAGESFHILDAVEQTVKDRPTIIFTIDNGGEYFNEDGEQITAAFMLGATPLRRRYVEYFAKLKAQNKKVDPSTSIGPCILQQTPSTKGNDTWVIADAPEVAF